MQKKPTLFEITQEIEALDELLIQDHGEVTDELEALTLFISDLLTHKTDNCVEFVKTIESEIMAAKERIKELKNFVDSRTAQIEKFSDYIKMCMDKSGKKKFVGTFFSIKVRKPVKSVHIENEELISDDFKEEITTTKILKADIKKVLSRGELVSGASLVSGKESVTFGMKSKKD